MKKTMQSLINRKKLLIIVLIILFIEPVFGYTIGKGGSPWNTNSIMDNTTLNDKDNVVTGILDTNADINYDLVFAWITDVQYSENANNKSKYFSTSLDRLNSFINYINTQDVSFLIHTGDLIDGNSTLGKNETLKELDRVEDVFKNFIGTRYYVLGNHDVRYNSFMDFKSHTGMKTPGDYGNYSFDVGNYHFVVLDAQYNKTNDKHRDSEIYTEGHIPQSQIDWLRSDLAATTKNTIIFEHQRLDDGTEFPDYWTFVDNRAAVRKTLEDSGKVIGVFNGHVHNNLHYNINGIHYFNLRAIIESYNTNSYAKVYLKGKNIYVAGFGGGYSYVKDDKWEEKYPKKNDLNLGIWGLSESIYSTSPFSYRFSQNLINFPYTGDLSYTVNRSFDVQDSNFDINFKVLAEKSTADLKIRLNNDNSEVIHLGFRNSNGGSPSLSDIYYKTSGSFVFLQDYNPNQWYTFRLTDFDFAADTYDIYIDNDLKINDAKFSGSKVNKLQISGNNTAKGTFFVDDIRVSNTNTGSLTAWFNAGRGMVTYRLDVNVNTPANTDYTVWYRQNGTGNFVQAGGVYTGKNIIPLDPKYQNTDVRIVLNGDQIASPELISVKFNTMPEIIDNIPPAIISWSNNKTNDDSPTLTINVGEVVGFNAIANQTINRWNWSVDNIDQNNNYNNLAISFTAGIHTVKVNAGNNNGTSNTITWTVTVNGLSSSPKIISWNNNKTKDTSPVLTINSSEVVKFNATADQSIDTWNWFVDNINQNNNYDNLAISFTAGIHTVKVNASNSNGTSNTISWTVIVRNIPASVSIISWGNNKTNNNSLSLKINVSEVVKFNATANQTITTWNWYRDGVDMRNNYNNFSISWDTQGIKNIIVDAANENGTSNEVIWTLNVTDRPSTTPITSPGATTTGTSGSGGSGGGGGGGGSSGEDYYNIIVKEKYDLYIFKDRVTSYKFVNLSNPIMSINIVGNVNAGETSTAVEVLRNTSSLVKIPAPGNVYKNVNMWVGTSGFGSPKNIKEAVITFRVENSWISSNSLASSDLKLIRWDGSKWDQLQTSEKMNDSKFSYYDAKTNAFSSFAITGLKESIPALTQTEIEQASVPAPISNNSGNFPEVPLNWIYIIGFFVMIAIFGLIYVNRTHK